MLTTRTINDDDEVVETTQVGLPGMIEYSTHDIEDELEKLDSYRAEQNLWREDKLGGIGINFGDW
jgi:hypothetical protein